MKPTAVDMALKRFDERAATDSRIRAVREALIRLLDS